MPASCASSVSDSSPITLILHHAERRIFDAFFRRLKERGFLKGRAVQRTDSLAIIAAVRELDLLELVMETLRLALEAIARHDPAWQKAHIPNDWPQNYGPWTQAECLIGESGPRASAEARRLLSRAGQDGFALLDALDADEAAYLRGLAAVEVLRTVWTQQCQRSDPQQVPIPTTSSTEVDKDVGTNTKVNADVTIRSESRFLIKYVFAPIQTTNQAATFNVANTALASDKGLSVVRR